MNAPSATITASIQVEGVTVTYANGVTAIRDARFRLGASSICALVGVNGSGKSTALQDADGLFSRPRQDRSQLPGCR